MNPANDQFLPDDYDVPKEEKYLKFKDPETKIRFLSAPIRGWVGWKDKKPVRKVDKKQFAAGEVTIDEKNKLRHFWAAPVWNYRLARIQVVEITQSTIQTKLMNLARDGDWGSPLHYDVKVTKKGDGMDTEYDVIALPKRELPEAAAIAWRESLMSGFDVGRLYSGGDPFGDGLAESAPPADEDGVPF